MCHSFWNRVRLIVSVAFLVSSPFAQGQSPKTGDRFAELRRSFDKPPDDCRIMMRWWWFGPSATKEELQRELETMKAGGIGGVEVQTTYPLGLDDAASGLRNYPFLSQEHLDNLRFASEKARELGLRFDVTLGSGWPYGGPSVPITEAAGMLRVTGTPIAGGADSVALPDMEAGEKFLAAFVVRESEGTLVTEGAQRLSEVQNGRLRVPPGEEHRAVLFFLASRTGQQVKRPALGAEGFVLDPYDRGAVEDYLHAVGDKFMQAFGNNPPYAVFSDSLEVYGANWSGSFLKEFQARRGYDLTGYLPELVGKESEVASEVRHDWGETLTELTDENYLKPIREWASEHHTRFRSQTYGTPPATLSSNALVDLPEGEGWDWKGFSAVRWAASASHLYGRPVTSSETWTWLHTPVFRATPLDMKAAADTYFLEGSNQLIGHGWPYSPKSAGEPGWHFYAAADFSEHNPWWLVMPDVARYLQRVSFVLRQGKPVNDVALLLPTDDAWAEFTAPVAGEAENGKARRAPLGASISVNQVLAGSLPEEVIRKILDAGFDFDFIDGQAIEKVGIPYPILILPDVKRLPLATYRKIEAYARSGGIVVVTGSAPTLAPGLKQSETDSPNVRRISEELFRGSDARGRLVGSDAELGATLRRLLTPDMALSPPAAGVGFVHRRLQGADIYFVANTTNQIVHTHAAFRVDAKEAELWDPVSGETRVLAPGSAVDLTLLPYQSYILFFSEQGTAAAPAAPPRDRAKTSPPALDLRKDWSVTFSGSDEKQSVKMESLRSWTDSEATSYYSGIADYEKTVDVPAAMFARGVKIYLDFGAGTPMEMPRAPSATSSDGTGSEGLKMQAWLESPVREAAQVFVNGSLAGSVWLPPYEVEVTKFLHPGTNAIKIVVGNLAINEVAGRAIPEHRLLYERYGVRFRDQDLTNLEPVPSGILGNLRLVARSQQSTH